jgi:hypothetical protein
MSLLKNLKTDASIAGEKDSLGGGRLFESGLLNMAVTMAYLKESDSGALGVFVTLKNKADNQELRVSQYVTSGKAKGQKNTYTDKDGNEQYLPGFLIMNGLAELTTGVQLSDLETEDKLVNIYSAAAKAEVPTKVPVLTQLIGQEINVGVVKQRVNKQIKNDAGVYVDTNDERFINEVDKFFCAKDKFLNMTVAEIKGKADEAKFYKDWAEKNTGKLIDRFKPVGNGTAGAPARTGAAAATGGTAKPASSLFG